MQIDPSERVRYLMIVDSENGSEITDCECHIILKNSKIITLKQLVLINCIQTTCLYSGDELMDYGDCFAIEDIQRIILVHGVNGIQVNYDFEFGIWEYFILD
ncbi:MAG: hypothetical protein A2W93_07745 [Bacteroidetes bacterium GWF2_43_63]|nr:MAG: hypothetical protein A2W94_09600 [Bacteroidetes bacterium GWE2_42_42]OFY53061.1 MAG: hypothetical protein A2W93_07745 [Bacteroidetes bacterium GWF2_43_63]HBG69175.1 hypothetical protein [Bacteroidales bacterium]HCB62554.1 hypothetical protein [Bacteroidales bacterium]